MLKVFGFFTSGLKEIITLGFLDTPALPNFASASKVYPVISITLLGKIGPT